MPKELMQKKRSVCGLNEKIQYFLHQNLERSDNFKQKCPKRLQYQFGRFPKHSSRQQKELSTFPLQNYFEEKDIKKIISATKEVLLKLKG
jgi:dTDP-4-amino-4,6-dideoxygalactose transaminase